MDGYPTVYLLDAGGVIRMKALGSPGRAVLDRAWTHWWQRPRRGRREFGVRRAAEGCRPRGPPRGDPDVLRHAAPEPADADRQVVNRSQDDDRDWAGREGPAGPGLVAGFDGCRVGLDRSGGAAFSGAAISADQAETIRPSILMTIPTGRHRRRV